MNSNKSKPIKSLKQMSYLDKKNQSNYLLTDSNAYSTQCKYILFS